MSELAGEGLRRLNIILSSISVLLAFSLMAYLLVYNYRNAVARALVLLFALVSIVYVGDLFLSTSRLPPDHPAAAFWLKFEWFGIAFAAPAFVQFSNALLEATGERSTSRRIGVAAAFGVGMIALAAVMSGSGSLVVGVSGPPGTVRLGAGKFFPAFAAWHISLTALGAAGIVWAWRRALTFRTRRRTAALLIGVIAPLSVFPFLTAGGAPLAERVLIFRGVNIAANLAVSAMVLIVAWEVAYRGSLTPERAVRRDLVKFLVQGPLLGFFILATIQLVPLRLESSLGLPRDIVLMLWTIVGIVFYQFMIRALKPVVDRLIFAGEGEDIAWLRKMDERLVSDRDLSQLLENTLALLCDRLRVETGCMVTLGEGSSRLDAWTGNRERAVALLQLLEEQPEILAPMIVWEDSGEPAAMIQVSGFLVTPLRSESGAAIRGLLAIEEPIETVDAESLELIMRLTSATARALEDRIVQHRILGALRDLQPELEGIQRVRGALAVGHRQSVQDLDHSLVEHPRFPTWVKDALSHYWGGPKLTENPLLDLGVVRRALDVNDSNPAKALRSVLDEALKMLKPSGTRSSTSSEWILYNILELKFVRGMKVRDIAGRLAMSESDLYRKQRVAVEALADQIAAMEGERDSDSGGVGHSEAGP